MGIVASLNFPTPIPGVDSGLFFQPTDWLALEAGANWMNEYWTLGWAGARFQLANEGSRSSRFVFDIDAGGVAGVGGERCGNGAEPTTYCRPDEQPDGRDWSDRAAGGGYLGAGFALHFSWFSLFVHDRLALTGAWGVPPTLWNLAWFGVQAAPWDAFRFWLGYTVANYWNEFDGAGGGGFDVGFAVSFDTWDPAD